MDINIELLKEDVRDILRNPENRKGLADAAREYSEDELTDPDTILSIARAVGVDLSKYRVGSEAPKEDRVFNTKYDTDQDLDDLNNDVDDLSGDYY